MGHTNEKWDIIVKPKTPLFEINFKEIWAYKDLITLLVKRDITTVYKQTLLGPLWMFIQPVFITAIYTFTFSYSAKISTDGLPPVLFYLLGLTFWNYFADCLNKTAGTFVSNASIFGKVYFPRLVVPISVVIANLIKLGLQFLLLLIVYVYFYLTTNQIHPQYDKLVIIPFLVIILGLLSLGIGLFFSSFTTKYRDFVFLMGFVVQLLMYASCVVFPISMYSEKIEIQKILMYNPIVSCLEAIKFVLTGHGYFSWYYLFTGLIITIFICLLSIIVFNRTEKTFMDTV